MAGDSVAPLCTWAQLTEGPFSDLVRSWTSTQAQTDLLAEATRECEEHCDRRLAPFTGLIESHRAEGIDPDEYVDSGAMPLDLAGSLGRNWAASFGSTAMIRRVHLSEYAPRYPELWAYSDVTVQVVRSYGGSETVLPGNLTLGPQPDTGFLWFQLGQFIPEASELVITYGGGYQTMPASLVRAGKYMAASIAATELDPLLQQHGHDPDFLRSKAEDILERYVR
ncbi:hypothetical protein [Streptacidiphilus sp. MAP5-3]|uniref:hypothetical protein n=1 Tax=unclassified Streptacidiphilus TaxID=2643834 RepID=UPI003512D155